MAKQNPSFIKNEFSALPAVFKGIIFVAAAGGLFLSGRAIVKAIKKYQDDKESKKEGKGWGQTYKDANKNPSTAATLSETEMMVIANRLQEAMDGYGTNDAAIKSLFTRVNTLGDLSGINNAFGVRTILAGHGIGWLTPVQRGTLSEMLQAENADIDFINKHLESKGISIKM